MIVHRHLVSQHRSSHPKLMRQLRKLNDKLQRQRHQNWRLIIPIKSKLLQQVKTIVLILLALMMGIILLWSPLNGGFTCYCFSLCLFLEDLSSFPVEVKDMLGCAKFNTHAFGGRLYCHFILLNKFNQSTPFLNYILKLPHKWYRHSVSCFSLKPVGNRSVHEPSWKLSRFYLLIDESILYFSINNKYLYYPC